jgi:hypothetical protein
VSPISVAWSDIYSADLLAQSAGTSSSEKTMQLNGSSNIVEPMDGSSQGAQQQQQQQQEEAIPKVSFSGASKQAGHTGIGCGSNRISHVQSFSGSTLRRVR